MHELAVAQGLVEIILQELEKHRMRTLAKAEVHYGPLSNIVPEALSQAFTELALQDQSGYALDQAELVLVADPLVLQCGECKQDFNPESQSLFCSCPHCGYEFFHQVKSGNELYLARLEAD